VNPFSQDGVPLSALFEMMLNGIPEPPPEAVDHLLNAAHEFLAAMRVLVDSADQAVDFARAARATNASGPIRRVPVD
jgi:hypothetical protein